MKKTTSHCWVMFVFTLSLSFQGAAQNTIELMKDLMPGTASSNPEKLTAFKNRVFFFAKVDSASARESLCASDGTPNGTQVILKLPVDSLGSPLGLPIVMGDKLYFFTQKNYNQYTIWISDGTSTGTNPLLTQLKVASSVTVFKGRLWFSFGKKIQYLDADLNSLVDFHTATSGVENLISAGDYIYWFSLEPNNPYISQNYFFRSNGQPGNVQFLQNVGESSSSTSGSSYIEKTTRYENGNLRWHTMQVGSFGGGAYYGGGKAGVNDLNAFATYGQMSIVASALIDSMLFLYTIDNYKSTAPPYPHNWRLLAGRIGDTLQNVLGDIYQIGLENIPDPPSPLFATSKSVFFRAWKLDTQIELGVSDGTAAGTVLVKDINPGPYSSDIGNFTACGDKVYFTAFDGTEFAVWRTDGTESGTQKIAPMPGDYHNTVGQHFLLVGEVLFMSIYTSSKGFELWKLSPLSCDLALKSQEPERKLDFSLAPNPSLAGSNYLIFLNEGIKPPYQISLIGMTGNVIWNKQIQTSVSEIEIPTNFLTPGIYLLTLEKDGSRRSKKLVLQR